MRTAITHLTRRDCNEKYTLQRGVYKQKYNGISRRDRLT